jgi:hypothetical protein
MDKRITDVLNYITELGNKIEEIVYEQNRPEPVKVSKRRDVIPILEE